MKAISAYNAKGTIHEWRPTAVTGWFRTKCKPIRQHNIGDLQAAPSDLEGMPLCKRCFPEHKGDSREA